MEQLFLTILNRGLTASLLVLVVILVRFIVQRAPKRFRCILWALVAFRLICPVSIESAFSLMPDIDVARQVEDAAATRGSDSTYVPGNIFVETGNAEDVINNRTDTANENIVGMEGSNSSGNQNDSIINSNTQQPLSESTWQQSAQSVAAYIWLAGIAAMGIYGVISYLRVKNQVKVSLRVKENIYCCDNIETPFAFGMFRAKIYLPSGLDETTAEYVIRHEQEHLRCKDMWWKLLGFLLLAVYWFHPMLWVAYLLFCKDIEYACDERAIQGMDDENRKQYVTALLNCSVGKKVVLFCPTAFGETSVKGRIKSVLSYKKATVPILVCAVVLVVVVVAAFLTDPKGEQQGTNLPEAPPTEKPTPTPTLAPGQDQALPTTMIGGEIYFMNGDYSAVKPSEKSRIKEIIEKAEYLGTTIHISERGYPTEELESNCFVEGSKVYRYVEGEKVNFIIVSPNELTYNYVSGWHKYRWFEGKLIDAGEQNYNGTGMPTPTPTPAEAVENYRAYAIYYEANPDAVYSAEDWLATGRLKLPFEWYTGMAADMQEDEMFLLFYIPEEALKASTTAEIYEIALAWPYARYSLYNFPSYYLNFITSKFNGMDELYQRDDLASTLLWKYKAMNFKPVRTDALSGTAKSDYELEARWCENDIVLTEILLATNLAFEQMTDREKEMVLAETASKMQLRATEKYMCNAEVSGFYAYINEFAESGNRWYEYLIENYSDNEEYMRYLEEINDLN